MFLGLEEGRLCSPGCRPEMRIHPLMRTLEVRFCPVLRGRINTGFGVLCNRNSVGISAPFYVKSNSNSPHLTSQQSHEKGNGKVLEPFSVKHVLNQ